MEQKKGIAVCIIKLLYKISQIGMGIFFYFAFILMFALAAGFILALFHLADITWLLLIQLVAIDLGLWVLCGLSSLLYTWCKKQFEKYYGPAWWSIIKD